MDITMCSGEGCLDKQNCYRFTAEASEYQSIFMNPPVKEDGTCDHYWDNQGYHNKKEKDAIPES